MASEKKRQEQIAKAERLQDLLLADFEDLFKKGLMTATDRANLIRLLSQNGWSLDPAKIPQGIRGLLTKTIDPTEFDEADGIN